MFTPQTKNKVRNKPFKRELIKGLSPYARHYRRNAWRRNMPKKPKQDAVEDGWMRDAFHGIQRNNNMAKNIRESIV